MFRRLMWGHIVRNGISGASVPLDLLYAGDINAAALKIPFSPILLYAIAEVETIQGQIDGLWPDAASVVASDGGTGLCQITPEAWWSIPMQAEWAACKQTNPYENAVFALSYFLSPAEAYWSHLEQGVPLVRCIAAEYNAGRANAIKGHQIGDVGAYTSFSDGVSYSDRVASNYMKLFALVPDA